MDTRFSNYKSNSINEFTVSCKKVLNLTTRSFHGNWKNQTTLKLVQHFTKKAKDLPLRVPPCFSFVRTDAESSFYFLSQFTMKTTRISLEDYLKKVVETQSKGMKCVVASKALETKNIPLFFKNLEQLGSAKTPGILVYRREIDEFFNSHYYEIEDTRRYYNVIAPTNKDLKSFLSHKAYEVVAYKIYQDWENGS